VTIYYGSNVANGTLATASTMSSTTGGTETTAVTTVSGGGVWCETFSRAASETAVGAIGSPSGKGWVASPGSGSFATGNWSAAIALSIAATATVAWTVRFYKYNGSTYTSIGTIATSGASLGTTRTVISFSATSMSGISFGSSDLLYVDLWMNDSTGTGGDNPKVYESNSATQGVANDVQVTTSTFSPSGGVTHKIICDGFGGMFT